MKVRVVFCSVTVIVQVRFEFELMSGLHCNSQAHFTTLGLFRSQVKLQEAWCIEEIQRVQ